jgi:hypothetical protein
VEPQQVELVDAELPGALLEGVQGGVVAVVADPDLGLNEDIVAVEARAADALADLALVAVGGGGVDMAVADPQRLGDRGGRLLGGRLTPRTRVRASGRCCSDSGWGSSWDCSFPVVVWWATGR